jgi:amidase
MGSHDGPAPWQERAAKKRQQCASKIPQEWKLSDQSMAGLKAPLLENKNNLISAEIIRKSGILTDRELNITEDYTVTTMISALADGSLTSVEVTRAYSKRAALAHQLVGIPSSLRRHKPDCALGIMPHGNYVRSGTRTRPLP